MKRIFYQGQEVDTNDIRIQWTDCLANECEGSIDDFESSIYSDALAEFEAGEDW